MFDFKDRMVGNQHYYMTTTGILRALDRGFVLVWGSSAEGLHNLARRIRTRHHQFRVQTLNILTAALWSNSNDAWAQSIFNIAQEPLICLGGLPFEARHVLGSSLLLKSIALRQIDFFVLFGLSGILTSMGSWFPQNKNV